LQKAVDLEVAFSGIEVDKVVLDRMRDPLVHLLRNAVDHGIESAERREILGKPERALIRVSAEVVGSEVHITVADDGSGIDPERVAEALVEKGVLSQAQAA